MYGGMHAIIDRALVPTVSLILPKNLAGLQKRLVEKDFGGLFFDILRRAEEDSEKIAKHYLGAEILDLSTLLVRDCKLNAEPSAGEKHPIIQT